MAKAIYNAYTSESTSGQASFGMHAVYLGDVRLPLAPGKITIKVVNRNTTVDLVVGAPLKILNDPGLTGYEFEIILPHDINDGLYPTAIYDGEFKSPQFFFDYFEKLKQAENPKDRVFPFLVLENQMYSMQISTQCTLDDYEISQDAEKDGLDYRVKLTLERYVPHESLAFEIIKKDGQYVAVSKEEAEIYNNLLAASQAFNAAQEAIKNRLDFANNVIATLAPYYSKKDPIVKTAKAVAKNNGISTVDVIKPGQSLKPIKRMVTNR